ncbi:carbohydrate ABC transporter membrane protein 1, CUT1 family [Devosia enhydra]|uniref:Carbohydrate ABC transporter membrane protein 1, CUT1 family n=1 Tax=Devosia enhydra TaxID=665118 RepID=A0A1K2HSB9_9HYPH|nr:carbohydrate ABC transporter membrane protein 1, CUT1 family [Devosia enhydra]
MADTIPADAGLRKGLARPSRASVWADKWIPLVVLSPSVVISLIFVYGFLAATAVLSFTNSTLMPRYVGAGFQRYIDLFSNSVWWTSVANLFWFSVPFIVLSLGLGLLLAILMDQRIRAEGALRAIYLYPLALSQIVAGTAWQWLFNPEYGIQNTVRALGFTSFEFNWLNDSRMAMACVVIAAVWQCTGFVAALFLAGLRGVDEEVIKAGMVDGASMPVIYRRIVLPAMWPVFFSVLLLLTHQAIKTFDLVVAMTAGGPGTSTWLPSYFMYNFSFERGRMGVGAASAVMILVMVVAILIPMMYLEKRAQKNAS